MSTGPGANGPLISAGELLQALDSVTLLDVRWELASGADRDAYRRGHIPGAAFVDLDTELAAAPGERGRHPLPDTASFEQAMRRAGVRGDRAVVVYDAGGAMAAARAWWLLRYCGHRDVSVLDGGLAAWVQAGLELDLGEPAIEPGDFVAVPGGMPLLDAAGAGELARTGVLVDARAPERYRGEHEPIDPVAGHIPGAINRPTGFNLGEDRRFRAAAALRAEFERLGVAPGLALGAYCGSGVTAAHEVLALELAGFRAALYAGSWSEWITDPSRPVASGAKAAD